MDTPVWTPHHPETSRMWAFMRWIEKNHDVFFDNYQQLHTWSIEQPSTFWQALVDYFAIQFDHPPVEVIHNEQKMIDARWFTGASFNFAEKLLSRNDNHLAIVSIDESGNRKTLTYHELQKQVAYCAAGLKQVGIVEGDRVAAILPNIAEAIIAMLATASIGALWSSCSPDFGANAIIDRLGQIEPKLLFVSDGHQYHGKAHDAIAKIKEICAKIPSLSHLVVCPHLYKEHDLATLPQAILWENFLKPCEKPTFTSLPFAHPLYILFSSGTTGKPKCIIHGAGGTLLQHIKELALHTDIKPYDNLCFYTTTGWMMWNWMVSTLALGATLTLYEGSPTYPDAHRLFQLIHEEKITVFGTSAKFISAVEKANVKPNKRFSLDSLRCILSTGSPLLTQNYDFVYHDIKKEVQLSSISGGTDIVSCFALGNPLLPVYKGELQCLGLGMAVQVFNETGESTQQGRGELVCTKPFPSMPIGFWHDPERTLYYHTYFDHFPGIWAHGDFAEITKHHGLIIYGRSDAVLNPGGVRIGTAEIYRQVEIIPEILESIVIGQAWLDDVRIVLFVKLQQGVTLTEALETKIRETIRNNASPRHVPSKILQVTDIPRTLSGKIVELAVKQVVHGQDVSNLKSLANPEALTYFANRDELRD